MSKVFLQILAISLILALGINAQQFYGSDSDTDYDSVPASPEPLMTRQTRNSIRNAIPPAAGPNGRRLAWNMFIRPGMAGGFRKRFSEREINTLLKNNWLG